MSRTRLFKSLRKAMQQALFAQKHGLSEGHLKELIGMGREKASRRKFLQGSAMLAMTPIAAKFPLIDGRKPERLPASKSDRVLILGAGGGGLAAGYTLMKAGIPFKILEASNRAGGRINTQFNFTDDGQFIERGAELVDTAHTTLIELATELGLEIEDFSIDESAKLEAELLYIEGKIRTHEDLTQNVSPFLSAVLDAQKAGAESVTFMDKGKNKNVEKWDNMSLAEFLDSQRNKVDSWVLKAIGQAYKGEIGRELHEQSSLNLITFIGTDLTNGFEIFGDSDESKRVKGGNMRLPMKLSEAIRKNRPGSIDMGVKVVAISQRGENIVVTVESNGNLREEVATQVICALPFSVLRDVEGIDKLDLRSQKLDAIKNWGYGQNTKIMMDFKKRFWRDPAENRPPSSGSYVTDLQSTEFWETSRLQAGNHGIITNFLGGIGGLNARRETIEKHCLPDLSAVHGDVRQHFVKGIVQNWNQIPTAKGSYTCMMPGHFLRFNGVCGLPEMNGKLLFAGEHASDEFAGFMNGAYETGVSCANKIIEARKAAPAPARGRLRSSRGA